jgi:hypothetical protein
MPQPTTGDLVALLAPQEPPCISLYQPTHRHYPDNQQDPILFKNLVKRVEESLRKEYPTRDVRGLLEPLHALAQDSLHWRHTLDGLAVLASPGALRVYHTQRPMPELAVVADSFLVKPLLRYLQSADRFQVLALTRDSARVYEGNRYALDEVTLPEGLPSRMDQVVPPERDGPGASVASSSAGVGSPKMVRGHGEGKEDLDAEKFFRAVDRAFTALLSKPAKLPVLLAALPPHQAMFRRVSQCPHLLADGVSGNPEALSADELRRQAWQALEPHYLARLARLKESFTTAQARQLGSSDLSDAARAAAAGRVAVLLVESERVIPGVIHRADGTLHPGDLSSPQVGDMLDDLTEMVLATGGEVVVVPKERMPSASGLAAVYRY